MLLLCLEENIPVDEVIFYDTGMEFDSIYRNRDRIKEVLLQKGIEFTELHPANPFVYDMLVRPVKYREKKEYPYHYGYGWCGGNARWATRYKLNEINKHYREKYPDEKIVEYVGIASDEPQRIKNIPRKKYPLTEHGMTERDCLQYCYDHGYNWDEDGIELYSILDRVSCWCCRNKNLKELNNIYKYLPKYWERLRGLQSRIDEPFKGPGKSIFDLEKRFNQEQQMTIFDFMEEKDE